MNLLKPFKLKAGERVELPAGTWNPLKQTTRGTRITRSDLETWEITGKYAGRDVVTLHRLSTDHTIEGQMAVDIEVAGPDKDGNYRFKQANLGALVLGDHVRLITISHVPTDPEGIFSDGIYFAEPFGEAWANGGHFGFPRNAKPEERSALMGLYKLAGKRFDKIPVVRGPRGEFSIARMSHDYSNLWSGDGSAFSSDEIDGVSLS